jgi:hypothetical protein
MGRNRITVFSITLCMTLFLCLTSIQIAWASDFEVDSQGTFNYKYELKLPPGTNGMGPNLNLAYNSNISNGILGMGWGLAGLPVIVRDPVYGINYTNEDHYLYNGEKLVPGADGYYHTERENFVRIKAFYLNSASSYWVLTLKNGTKMYFGDQTGNGHINAVGKAGKAYAWALNKVIDIYGNYYEVEYHEDVDNGGYYPVRITYTKNDQKSLKAYRTMEFSYETRTDHGPMYNFSAKVDTDKRLRWITVKVDGNLLRKYRMDYEYGTVTRRSRLIAIQEYGSDGNVPPVPWVEGSFEGTGKVLIETKLNW